MTSLPTLLVVLFAAAAGGAAGWLLRRRGGWAPEVHRMALAVLLVPWFVQHLSLARLARSDSLNPIRRATSTLDVVLADVAAPLVMAALLVACLVWVRRLRVWSTGLPLLGELLLWWVTVPLYQRLTVRGWFFVTEGLAGPLPLAYQVAAAALLAAYALPPD